MNTILIKKPVITEKAMDQTKHRIYTFEVKKVANKHQIQEQIEKLYSVTIQNVHTFSRKGKTKRAGKTRNIIVTGSRKYARVQLIQGQTIDSIAIAPEGK